MSMRKTANSPSRFRPERFDALRENLTARMRSADLYQQKSQVKVSILITLLLFSAGWFYYTNNLIAKLAVQEEKSVAFYAQSLEYALTSPLEEDVNFFMEEVVKINKNIPVIYENQGRYSALNLELPADTLQQQAFLKNKAAEFSKAHPRFPVRTGFGTDYIYYTNSFLYTQLQFYPAVMLLGLLIFGYMAYLAFSASRRSEQNRVWVGLAKETAHQLGTPLSGLKGWVAYFRTDPDRYEPEYVTEMEKDVERLETITARFSSIGSLPTLTPEPIGRQVAAFLQYLQRRVSSKVKFEFINELPEGLRVSMNRHLFEWVVENLCKNAVDAMEGSGKLSVRMQERQGQVLIDISDTGRGIPKSSWKTVFNPGFSTKKRGWGLGLTLSKRIIENYHRGRLYVYDSAVGKGTTFRIILPKQ